MQRSFINVANSKLPEGMKKCKHCEGIGFVPMIPDDPDCGYIKGCSVCKGSGYVDWIAYAVGYVEEKKIEQGWPSNTTAK